MRKGVYDCFYKPKTPFQGFLCERLQNLVSVATSAATEAASATAETATITATAAEAPSRRSVS